MKITASTSTRLLGAALCVATAQPHAATFTVGAGIDGRFCDFNSLQAAIDAAAAADGADTIRITDSLGMHVGGVEIHDDDALTLEGGYADCLAEVGDHGMTRLDFGSSLGIEHAGSSNLTLLRLDLSAQAMIVLRDGSGSLDVIDSHIHDAGDFGGIHATGSAPVRIERTTSSGNLSGVSVFGGSLTMVDSDMRDNAAAGVVLRDATATVTGSLIHGNGTQPNALNGGLRIEGSSGSVDLVRTAIFENRSAYNGAGISIEGSDAAHPLALRVGEGVRIADNIAAGSGGGIHARNANIDMTAASGSLVELNSSGTSGGGIAIHGGRADIASSSGPAVEISRNHAEYAGGGLYATEGAQVRLFTADASTALRVTHNGTGPVSSLGGGIAVFQDGSGSTTRVFALDTNIETNFAILGGGVVVYSDGGDPALSGTGAVPVAFCLSTAAIREQDCDGLDVPSQAVACAGGNGCPSLADNSAGAISLTASSPEAIAPAGAAVAAWGPAAWIRVDHARITGNTGPSILSQSNHSGSAPTGLFDLSDSLIVGNRADEAILRQTGDAGTFALRRSTIANNEIDGTETILVYNTGSMLLREDIVFQPGVSVYCCSWDNLDARFVLAHETASLPPAPDLFPGDPHFVDANANDFRLADDSPAIDVSDLVDADGPGLDLAGFQRGVDVPDAPNLFGPRDLGAYELQLGGDAIFSDGFEAHP